MTYNSAKDRSEEFGWKRVCEEHVPTDQEQEFWGNLSMVLTLLLAAFTIIGNYYGIF